MKLGIELQINFDDIDQARLFQGKKGRYLNVTTFVDVHNPNQYGNHGFICQSKTEQEKQDKAQLPILGNTTVFYNSESAAAHPEGINQARQAQQAPPQRQAPPQQQPPPQQAQPQQQQAPQQFQEAPQQQTPQEFFDDGSSN